MKLANRPVTKRTYINRRHTVGPVDSRGYLRFTREDSPVELGVEPIAFGQVVR